MLAAYYFHLLEKNYVKVRRIIIDLVECNTYWQKNFDFFVNIKTVAK